MRQSIKDVVYILAVVAASVLAALMIGWILAGCDPSGDESVDTDADSDTEINYCININGICWDLENTSSFATYQEADEACAGSDERLPTASDVMSMLGDCSDYILDASSEIHCAECSGQCLGLGMMPEAMHWTSDLAPGDTGEYVWVFVPGSGILKANNVANYGIARCVTDV